MSRLPLYIALAVALCFGASASFATPIRMVLAAGDSMDGQSPETLVDLYYGELCDLDAYRANHLRDLENVRHNIIDDAPEHTITLRIIARGEFQDSLVRDVDI